MNFGKMTKDEILKEKTSGQQHRDFSDKGNPVLVQMSMEDCQKACKRIGVEYKKGYENRILRYVCSDASVDRVGDIIKQEGWKIENFKKNPVVMGFHDYGTFPVGNALTVGVVDNKLKMDVLFAGKEVNEDADKAFRMAKSGFMKAGSVGFKPDKYHMASEKEVEELGMGKFGIMFEEQELMEYSVCGVPANANALQESISKGMFKKADFKGWAKEELYNQLKDIEEKAEHITGDTGTTNEHKHIFDITDPEKGNGTAKSGDTGHSHTIKEFKVQTGGDDNHTHSLPADIGKQKPKTTEVQTLIFDKEKFSKAQAIKWAKDHDFIADKVDETENSFRIRQKNPDDFQEGTFSTINIDTGIKAVIGKPKEKVMDGNDQLKQLVAETIKQTLEEQKAGAVLSKKNKESITTAIEAMKTAVDALDILLKNADSSKEEPDDVSNDNELEDGKSIIEIDLDTIDDVDSDEALYSEENIINIEI